jgi:hypothetical protein
VGRHRKPKRVKADEAKRAKFAEQLLDEVTEIVLDCYEVTEDGTETPADTVSRLARLLKLHRPQQ